MAQKRVNDVVALNTYAMEHFEPGQFFMVWLPGIDEKPMSVTSHEEGTGESSITVEKKAHSQRSCLN